MGIPWILRREYTPFIANNFENPVFENLLNNFSSSIHDEYPIEGEMGMPLPPFVARFSESLLHGNMLGTADEDGHVMLLDTRKTKESSTVKEWSAHSNAVFDLAWIEDEPRMVTASGDQTARLWDVEKAETIAIFRGHTCSLKSVAVAPQSKEIFVTGARDGKIMLWDTRYNRKNGFNNPINTISGAHVLPIKETTTLTGKKRRSRRTSMYQADSKASVTSAIFQGSQTVISSGACDGTLKFWDLRKTYTNQKGDPVPLHTIPFPGASSRVHGYSCLVTNTTMSRLYAVCTNDMIYEYSTTNNPTSPLAVYQGHLVSSFYVKAAVSPCDRYLLCGSSDGNAYVWRTDKPALPWLLKGHNGEVTSVTWSPNQGEKIVTCSDDNSFKIWRQFQCESVSKTDIPGRCERRKNNPGEILEEPIVESPTQSEISHKPNQPNKSLTMNTHRKCTVHWIIPPLQNNKQKKKPTLNKNNNNNNNKLSSTPICKTPDVSILNNSRTTPSPFTTVTPKAAPSSSSSIRSSTQIKRSVTTPTPSSARRKLQPVTPKTSRSFMETWLNSPKSASKEIDDDSGSPLGEKLNPIYEANEYNTKDTDAGNESSKIVEQQTTKSSHRSNKNTNEADYKNCNERVVKRRLINKYGRGKTNDKNKKDNSAKSENIKTLLVSGSSKKRKRGSEDDENEAENSVEGKRNSKTMKLDGTLEKENVASECDDVFEIGQDGGRTKTVLSGNTIVKDLLDIAENSS